MSSFTPILISPFSTGIDTDLEPWLIPPDGFTTANNVHIYHGYVQQRDGYSLFGTLSNGTRVLGLFRYIKNNGDKSNLAFDTTRAYLYNETTHVYDQLDTSNIMNSGEYDYVWGTNWQSSNIQNRLYFTNGKSWNGQVAPNALDGIRYFDELDTNITTLFTPSTGGGNTLYGGKLLFTLGQRLIVLYTYENDGVTTTSNPQRARWCAKQDPANWNDVVAGGGDFADAATGDQIISAQALQNQIIVFFTNSVWSLLPTSDPNKAFRWVRLNSFRACDGKMASVAYDRYVVCLGVRGITATDGTETRRIDNRIQGFTSSEINVEEFKKVFCYRSFETSRWWTLYAGIEAVENNSALIYDDESKAFTTYSIGLNCLGYGNAPLDYSLDEFSVANALDYSLNEMGDDTLQDWYWAKNQDILLAGSTTGKIYQLEIGANDDGASYDAELITAAWNPFQQESKEAQMSYIDLYVDTDKYTTGTIFFYKNDEDSPYSSQKINFLPQLNYVASISSITQADPCKINAPGHGLSTGSTVYIYGVIGMIQVNSGNGYVITVVDGNNFTLDGVDSSAYTAYSGAGGVYLLPFVQTKTWIRAYAGGIGYLHQVRIEINGGDRPFRMHAIKPFFRPRGKRTINP